MAEQDFDEQMNRLLLTMDPLLEAEKITGKSYKEDKETEGLGLWLLQAKALAVEEQMNAQDDTHRHTSFTDVVRIYKEEGFSVVYEETFSDTYERETFHTILWHPDGALAVVDSYTGLGGVVQQNRNTLYFNWISNQGRDSLWPSLSLSGGLQRRSEGYDGEPEDDPWIMVGDLYMNEGLRHKLRVMRSEGHFVSPWLSDPHVRLAPRNLERTNDFKDPDWIAKWRASIWADKQKYLPADVAEAVKGGQAWRDND